MIDLPSELWNAIFDLAADEHVIFNHSLPTVMAESAWFRSLFEEWQLRTPQESLNLIQRRSYGTKKAIISTCQKWRRLGSEFLVRCLFFDDPTKLQNFCDTLNRDPNLGWWTRRINITRYYAREGVTMDDMANTLVSIIKHCPNLEIFIVDWPMATAFGPIADALCTYCSKSLRSVHWHIPGETLPKVIWALDSLRSLQSVHIEIEAAASENIHLGAASDLHLKLKNLQQLSLSGYCQEFLEQAAGWSMPALRTVSFDFGSSRDDLPDIMEFLTHHGTELTFLDLNCVPTLETATILDLCPFLTTFTFNPDWFLPTTGPDSMAETVTLANRPHQNITQVGCHGLLYAFGVGYAAAYASVDPLRTHLIRRTNEKNMGALTKDIFPNLKKVRVLSRTLLRALEKSNGPEEKCYERWETWWAQFSSMGVRLEDCTGSMLGTLPEEDVDEDEDEESEEDEDSEEGEVDGDDKSGGEEVPAGPRLGQGALFELRELLEECRKMSSEREELPGFPQFDFANPGGPRLDGPSHLAQS